MDKKNKLKPVQFYQWRLSVEQLMHAQTKKVLVEHKVAIMKKDIDIAQMKMSEVLSKLRSDVEVKGANAEYKRLKADIEKELGRSLDNCTIDEYTFEITKLPNKDGEG